MSVEREIEARWAWIVGHDDPIVRSAARLAERYPSLRRMFPFASLRNLRFSCATTYPYNWDLPFVRCDGERFQAVGHDSSVLSEGALEDVIARVASAMEEESVARKVALLRRLDDDCDLVRAEAIESIVALRDSNALNSLVVRLCSDPSALVRATAAEMLGELGERGAVHALLDALSDEDRAVRGYAANSLGLLGTTETTSLLDAAVQREVDPAALAELHAALYRLGASASLSALMSLLATANEALAINLANILEDLVSRRRPPSFEMDAPRIDAALSDLAARFSIVSTHVARIRSALRRSE